MALAAQAAALGAMVFSYYSDTLFWVVNRSLGIKDPKEQILVWSVPTTLAWATSTHHDYYCRFDCLTFK